MRRYNRDKSLIFIHTPKCAGTSVDLILRKWFGENYLRHGFNKQNPWFRSTSYELKPGICIGGHFSWPGNEGVQALYPKVDQFITFMRDPFEIALSQYFFWKRKRRGILIKEGTLKEGNEDDFKNINDFFKKRRKSIMLNFMPYELTIDNYEEVFDKHFVYIGIVEDLQTSVNVLADKLGFPKEKIDHLNSSERDETVSEEVKNEFVDNNLFEYFIYNYILTKYNQ